MDGLFRRARNNTQSKAWKAKKSKSAAEEDDGADKKKRGRPKKKVEVKKVLWADGCRPSRA